MRDECDIVGGGEAPDDETVAKLALTIGGGSAIRTQTLRAFMEDEYRKIIAALPWVVAPSKLSQVYSKHGIK
jgi:uncharacterized protein with GYD domain